STFARSYDAHPRDLPSFPTDALPICAATTNGAIKLNLQNRIGSLEAGKDADMVILNSNPMDSISNTADIWRVVRRGQSLEWRVGSRWPLSSDIQANWAECRDWNMGVT